MTKNKLFSLKGLVFWLVAAILVTGVAWLLNLLTGWLTSISGGFATALVGFVLLILLGLAIAMHPGKEDILMILGTALLVLVILGILQGFGIGLFSVVFNLTTIIGWAAMIISVLFGVTIAAKLLGKVGFR